MSQSDKNGSNIYFPELKIYVLIHKKCIICDKLVYKNFLKSNSKPEKDNLYTGYVNSTKMYSYCGPMDCISIISLDRQISIMTSHKL